MDEQQQQRVNRAAEEFANAIVESQRTKAERGVLIQEVSVQLTQEFYDRVVDNLQRMAEENQGASQHLADQTQRAKEATRALTQEGAGIYMEFMNSMFSRSQGTVRRGAEEAGRGT